MVRVGKVWVLLVFPSVLLLLPDLLRISLKKASSEFTIKMKEEVVAQSLGNSPSIRKPSQKNPTTGLTFQTLLRPQ